MSDSTLPLDQYPPHIIQAIAFYSEEKALWRLMATSKAFREVAEVELRPYLVEKKITVEPLLVHDIFKPISPSHLLDPPSRRTELARRSELLESHFAAYPPSASALRHLTTEVRDDDDITGWTHVTRFANQLEGLVLHLNDRTWRTAEKHSHEWETVSQLQDLCTEPGEEAFFGVNVGHRVINAPFSNLITLTLIATANVDAHLRALSPWLPRLHELILGCHWCLYYDEAEYVRKEFDGLERFTAIGNEMIVVGLLNDLLPTFPDLRFLTVHLSDWSTYQGAPDLTAVSEAISCFGYWELEGLAFYGASAAHIVPALSATQLMLRDPQSELDGECGLQHITTLALEQTVLDENGSRVYPLISSTDDRPEFPALQSLILILNQNGEPPAEFEIYYDLPQLQALFAAYPTLQTVRWVSGYPTLGVDETFDTGIIIRCMVARVASASDQSVLENVNLVRGS